MRRLQTLIDTLDGATDRHDLKKAITDLTDLFEVDHVVYHSIWHGGEEYAAATYSPEWQQHYEAEALTRDDPVVRGCLQACGPVRWESLDWTSKTAATIRRDSIDAGLGTQGLSLPVRGPDGQFAAFTLNHTANDRAWRRQVEDLISDAILVSNYVNQKALEFVETERTLEMAHLSPRESDALSLLAVGMNRAQAAESLAISEHTLRVHIENARAKLGAANTVHAVARAMSLGLLAL